MDKEKTAEDIVKKSIEDWQVSNTEAKIKRQVKKLLDKGRDEIIVKMAGFDNHWGKWEVDHCNARQSQVNDYIKKIAQEGIREWIKDNLQNLPEMSEEMVAALLKDYKTIYLREVEKRLYDLTVAKAYEDAKQYVEEFTEKFGLPNVKFKLEVEDDEWRR